MRGVGATCPGATGDDAAAVGRRGAADHKVRQRCVWLIRPRAATAATSDRIGADAERDMEGRAVRVGSENAASDFGALELRKPKQGKGATRFRGRKLKFGSSGRTRTYNPSVNSQTTQAQLPSLAFGSNPGSNADGSLRIPMDAAERLCL
jgi:hypothetical protein